MRSLFGSVYAPSTLGSFLRTFTHGHVRQLQAAARDTLCFVDIDSMLRRVYGKQKQGIGFGHAKVGGYNVYPRGYNPLVATLSTPLSAVTAATRLRSGNAGSARGAATMIAEAVTTARACGASGEIMVRADSAFYAKTVISGCRRRGVRFSVTCRIDPQIRAACDGIAADQWVDITYPQAVWDEDAGRWISDAQIAETTYTAFAGTRHEATARLIVRRADPRRDHTQPHPRRRTPRRGHLVDRQTRHHPDPDHHRRGPPRPPGPHHPPAPARVPALAGGVRQPVHRRPTGTRLTTPHQPKPGGPTTGHNPVPPRTLTLGASRSRDRRLPHARRTTQ
ncbi:transposase, partial [Micromonospora sp. LOL_014]